MPRVETGAEARSAADPISARRVAPHAAAGLRDGPLSTDGMRVIAPERICRDRFSFPLRSATGSEPSCKPRRSVD